MLGVLKNMHSFGCGVKSICSFRAIDTKGKKVLKVIATGYFLCFDLFNLTSLDSPNQSFKKDWLMRVSFQVGLVAPAL